MSKVIAGLTISLDGFVNDRHGSVAPLYPDFESFKAAEPLKESIKNTGAVVMGRHAFAMAEDPDWYAGNYEYQTPIFVLTHKIPNKKPKETNQLSFTFVTGGIESAIAQARSAAHGKEVTVIGGASTIRQCIKAGLADELHLDVMPVLPGGGLRLFEGLDVEPVQLERLDVLNLPKGRTHFKFRIENTKRIIQPESAPESDEIRLKNLERKAEAAYDDMYAAENPRVYYSIVKDTFVEAMVLARKMGRETDAQRFMERLAHIKSVFNSQF